MPPDASRCPLCGGPNACALAAGNTAEPCWCTSVAIGPELLERIPAAARGVACVCARCAAGSVPAKAPAGAGDGA